MNGECDYLLTVVFQQFSSLVKSSLTVDVLADIWKAFKHFYSFNFCFNSFLNFALIHHPLVSHLLFPTLLPTALITPPLISPPLISA